MLFPDPEITVSLHFLSIEFLYSVRLVDLDLIMIFFSTRLAGWSLVLLAKNYC